MQELFVTAVDAARQTAPRKKGKAAPRLPTYMRDSEKKPGLTGQPLWDALDAMEARRRG